MCKIWLQKSETQGQQEELVDKDTATNPDDLSSIPEPTWQNLRACSWNSWNLSSNCGTHMPTPSHPEITHILHTRTPSHKLLLIIIDIFLRSKRIEAKDSNSCMIEYLTSMHEFLTLTSTMARKNKKKRKKEKNQKMHLSKQKVQSKWYLYLKYFYKRIKK